MTGAEAARLVAEGRLAAAIIAVPMAPDEHELETRLAEMWLCAMVRLAELRRAVRL